MPMSWERLLNPARLEDVSLPAITVCNGDTQWTPPLAFAPELTTLKAARDVARGGRTLRVGRARFRNIPFNDEQTQGVSYTYVGRYEALPIALVRVVYVEGDAWVLVDPKTGAHEDVAAFPLPGPDGHTFIGATLENEYDDTGIEIVEWRDGKPEQTIPWTATKRIKRVYTRQKLLLSVKEELVTATIDGHELGVFPLTHPAKGNVGLCVAEPGLTIEFWNVVIKPL